MIFTTRSVSAVLGYDVLEANLFQLISRMLFAIRHFAKFLGTNKFVNLFQIHKLYYPKLIFYKENFYTIENLFQFFQPKLSRSN